MNFSINLPNLVTSLRIVLIPVLVVVFYLPYEWRFLVAGAVFSLASVTDWLDGYLARKLQQLTPFGAFLDPVADKLIVAVALVLLVELHATPLLAVPAIVIVGREIVVSALREWMAQINERKGMAVSYLGKVKTTCQMVAIIILLANGQDMTSLLLILGYLLLYGAAILTLWSMLYYLRLAWPHLSSGMKNE